MHLDLRGQETRLLTETAKAFYDDETKIIVHRGGTRSSKTVSIIQFIVIQSFILKRKRILVTRKTLPGLKTNALKDFKDIIDYDDNESYGLDIRHLFKQNKTDNYFINVMTETEIHFKAYAHEYDVKGGKWDIVFMNEGDGQPFGIFRQLILRSPGKIIIDFNPDDENIWINTELEQKRKDVTVIQSGYVDNIFLPQSQVDEIEYLRETDPNYFNIYGLGEYGNVRNKIYSNYKFIDNTLYEAHKRRGHLSYGVDFSLGTSPSTLMECVLIDKNTIAVKELFYKEGGEPEDIIKALDRLRVNTNDGIFCDHFASGIRKIRAAGYKAIKAKKDVKDGLLFCKSFNILIHEESVNFEKEIKAYRFKEDNTGQPIEGDVIKFNDHALDGFRYGAYTGFKNLVTKIY